MAVLEHSYTPQGSALEAFHSRAPEILLTGPAGTGKSRALLEKLHLMCLLNPGMRGLIVRKTLVSLTTTALVTYREYVAKEAIEAGTVTWYGGSTAEAAQYRYNNGSSIMLGAMDKATKIMSSEYDIIYVQEAIELQESDWEALTTRLRNGKVSFQQIMADTNPDTPTHWLKQRMDSGKTTPFESRHEDNPTIVNPDGTYTSTGASYMAKLDNLTGVRYQRLRKGLWVAAEGQVYEDWDPKVHLINHFTIPRHWPRFWSIDFGYTNPFVLQMWATDPDGRMYLYREIYRTRRRVDEHAALALSYVTDDKGAWTEPKPTWIVCDHDAEGRDVFTNQIGLGTSNAHKAVLDGIQAVQKRLAPAKDGKPRLFILRDSVVDRDTDLLEAKEPTSTQEEVVGYIWDTGAGKAPKEQPLKHGDHGMDAMRYAVAQFDLASRPRVRFL